MKTVKLELLYQKNEKERMKEEATYAMNKWEITPKEYEKLIFEIISGHKDIISKILKDENRWDC
jgi:hypothetical protein